MKDYLKFDKERRDPQKSPSGYEKEQNRTGMKSILNKIRQQMSVKRKFVRKSILKLLAGIENTDRKLWKNRKARLRDMESQYCMIPFR